jgi:superfamily I DNA/RNA helicase
MSAIEIVSASAGSGKTYELAKTLEEAIKDGTVRPQAVIATTFTRKAAAELKERVRKRLLEAGMAEEAQRLNAAVMGTVNSVCGRLVTDFAFDLGLSPELRVLDEDMAAPVLRRALFGVLGQDMDEGVARLQRTFYEWELEPMVSRVLELARANGLSAQELVLSRDRCLGELGALLGAPYSPVVCSHERVRRNMNPGKNPGPPPLKDGAGLEKKLGQAVDVFLAEYPQGGDTTKATGKAAETARQVLSDLRAGRTLRWQDWSSLANLGAAKKSAGLVESINALAAEHVRLPEFRADIEAAVRTVFDLAARALETYREYKVEHGFIDFVDQECLALELLDKPEVRERLEGVYDLVLVDEFQDTSPIQLAIFLKLAEVAKRSVWVGDQKQSIFGFRGSDPELMNAAIDTILGGRKPKTLPKSWRSRPELVRVTSELFARAFPKHGIPAERVRLEPAKDKEAAGLGPVIERWYPAPAGRKKRDKTAALAAGIKALLEEGTVLVRDRLTGEARKVEARDVAVLCRTNKTAAMIADGLAGIGIKSAVSRAGLMKTPEAKLILAAIRLWSDPGDALSAAEMARILDRPDEPDRWLETLLERPGHDSFGDVPAIRAIRKAGREERSRHGVLATFDRIMELLAMRDLCRRWGIASERLANLNVLRAYAVQYVGRAADEGAGMTPVGLATFLDDLDDGTNDERAFSPDADAVVVSTWHRAKGLEWPIVILYDLEWTWKRLVPDIHVATDRPRIELDDPLAERWIRYWPHPYHPKTKTSYHELMEGHPVIVEVDAIERRESLRLLYVGWTRARDRVVLPPPEGKLGEGMLGEFTEERKGGGEAKEEKKEKEGAQEKGKKKEMEETEKGEPLLSEPVDGFVGWGGMRLEAMIRRPSVGEGEPLAPEAEATFIAPGPRDWAAASAWPDMEGIEWAAGRPEIIGEPIALNTSQSGGAEDKGSELPFEMKDMGSAVHAFIAADSEDYAAPDRMKMAEEILARWNAAAALRPADLVEISNRLRGWASAKWPHAKWHREWPVYQRLDTGSVTSGVADLILETAEGLVIIDHKAYPGVSGDAAEYAVGDAAQVQVYADTAALATGKPILGTYIHFPLIGAVVNLAFKKSAK